MNALSKLSRFSEPLDVAVLMGGWSAEREVSLVSGNAVADALIARGHLVRRIDVSQDLATLTAALTPRPAVAFNALHGRGGEDGVIQGVLSYLGLPVTHSGVAASAIAMDKPMTKRLAQSAGIRVAQGVTVTRDQVAATVAGGLPFPAPYIAKPADEGSSVGVHLISDGQNDWRALEPDGVERRSDDLLLIEEYIPGQELTVGVMDGKALTVTEIFHGESLFDYKAKYTAGVAQHVLPADIPGEVFDAAMVQSVAMHDLLGCRGVTRCDFRWDDRQPGAQGLVFLEINTQPGFTPISLVPEQAAHGGTSFEDLCEWLIADALTGQMQGAVA